MVWNYKEESELVKSADMAFEILQQSHNINALGVNQSAAFPEDKFDQLIAASSSMDPKGTGSLQKVQRRPRQPRVHSFPK